MGHLKVALACLLLFICGLPPAARADADQELAYCLAQKETVLHGIEDFEKASNDSKSVIISKIIAMKAKSDINERKQMLEKRGLYTLATNMPSPKIADAMDQARKDANLYINGDFARCTQGCVDNKGENAEKETVLACVHACEPFMTDADKHYLSCGQSPAK